MTPSSCHRCAANMEEGRCGRGPLLFLDAGYVVPAGGGVMSDFQYFSFGWGGKYLF